MYPEFTGTVTSSLIKPPMTGLSNDPAAVYEAAKAAILKQDDLVLLTDLLQGKSAGKITQEGLIQRWTGSLIHFSAP